MAIVGRKYEDGLSWGSYGCSVNHSRGASVCSNSKTVSERIVDQSILALLSKAVRSKDFKKWVQNAMALAAQEHAREKAANNQEVRLEREIKDQEAKIQKVGQALIDSPDSDFLHRALRAEEGKLRDLRHALAKASVPKNPAPVPEVTLDQVLSVLDQVEKVAAKSPARVREVLAGVIEPVIRLGRSGRPSRQGPPAMSEQRRQLGARHLERQADGTDPSRRP